MAERWVFPSSRTCFVILLVVGCNVKFCKYLCLCRHNKAASREKGKKTNHHPYKLYCWHSLSFSRLFLKSSGRLCALGIWYKSTEEEILWLENGSLGLRVAAAAADDDDQVFFLWRQAAREPVLVRCLPSYIRGSLVKLLWLLWYYCYCEPQSEPFFSSASQTLDDYYYYSPPCLFYARYSRVLTTWKTTWECEYKCFGGEEERAPPRREWT